jgi:hypothetical protein
MSAAQAELLGQRLGKPGVLGGHVVHLEVARQRELQPHPNAVQRRVAVAHQPHRRRHGAQASELVVVLSRLQADVVTEPLRLLVGVGVAAHVDQQRGVVDGCSRLLVEADPLCKPQCDQALAQHVLHRLPEAEVDPERKRPDELGEANVRAIGFAAR